MYFAAMKMGDVGQINQLLWSTEISGETRASGGEVGCHDMTLGLSGRGSKGRRRVRASREVNLTIWQQGVTASRGTSS